MPGRTRRDDPETRIHCRAVSELRLAFERRGFAKAPLFHPVNEGKLPPQYRSKLLAKGLSTGAPDLFIRYPCCYLERWYPGAVIELKAPGNTADEEQEQWLAWFAEIGWFTDVLAGHRAAAHGLVRLGYIHQTQADTWLVWAARADPKGM